MGSFRLGPGDRFVLHTPGRQRPQPQGISLHSRLSHALHGHYHLLCEDLLHREEDGAEESAKEQSHYRSGESESRGNDELFFVNLKIE